MTLERPNLSTADPAIVVYIESLEAEIDRLRDATAGSMRLDEPPEPSEPPTTRNLITISADGLAKRTLRHFYTRQKRGGMGVFDMEMGKDDLPALLAHADLSTSLIVLTDQARAFRLPVQAIIEGDVRSRGQSLHENLPLRPDERVAVMLPEEGGSHVILVSQRGQVRRVAARYFGASLQSGTVLYDISAGGAPAAACWTRGDDDLFIATRTGRAIRFAERQVPIRGCLGMRVDPSDSIVGAAGVGPADGVFLLSAEGKGTIRLMSGFNANKSPGAAGKTAIRCDQLVGAIGIRMDEVNETDLFAISAQSKVIRFTAAEVPPKEGVVQGVNCMALRNDSCLAMTST